MSSNLFTRGLKKLDENLAGFMWIAVLGCGAVGGVIAACLTRAGHDPTAIVSNPRIETALLTSGYRFSDHNRPPSTIPISRPPVKTPREAGYLFDLVITATPSTVLETALSEMLPCLARDGIVITCQNGLPEERAVAVVGERVVGCVVGWGAAMNQPGYYRRTSSGKLQIGKATPACPPPSHVGEVLGAVSPVEVMGNLGAPKFINFSGVNSPSVSPRRSPSRGCGAGPTLQTPLQDQEEKLWDIGAVPRGAGSFERIAWRSQTLNG